MENGGPLTTGDVAGLCHVSHVTVFRWIKRGLLKAYTTPGGHYRVRASDLLEFLNDQGMPVPERIESHADNRRGVLLVDDDPVVLETLRTILAAENGLDLATAEGGYEACIKIGAGRPDLIIVDLFMPGFDGFSVIREVRANPDTNGCRILVLTGYGTEENRRRALAYGADAFLEKPVDGPALLQRVKDMLKA